MSKSKESGWTLAIKDMSWVENTEQEVEFLIKTMSLNGTERILDLACGFGRHSLALAERGFSVVGVDITPVFIEDAKTSAAEKNLDIEFICSDIRSISYVKEFDVVLNLADGAIGYFENEHDNMKIFDVVSRALKPGGKHFMDICNGEHAECCFPERCWEAGSKTLSLADFRWDAQTKRMLYSESVIPYGELVERPVLSDSYPGIRLYSKEELKKILEERGMTIIDTYSDYLGAPDSYKNLQLMVYSRKC